MSEIDGLEDSLTTKRLISAENAVRISDDYGFGEPPPHRPHLQWSWSPLQEAVHELTGTVLAPFRFLARLIPRG